MLSRCRVGGWLNGCRGHRDSLVTVVWVQERPGSVCPVKGYSSDLPKIRASRFLVLTCVRRRKCLLRPQQSFRFQISHDYFRVCSFRFESIWSSAFNLKYKSSYDVRAIGLFNKSTNDESIWLSIINQLYELPSNSLLNHIEWIEFYRNRTLTIFKLNWLYNFFFIICKYFDVSCKEITELDQLSLQDL